MKCSVCGGEILPGQYYCPVCGMHTEDGNIYKGDQIRNMNLPKIEIFRESKKIKIRKYLIVILIFFVLIVAGLAYWAHLVENAIEQMLEEYIEEEYEFYSHSDVDLELSNDDRTYDWMRIVLLNENCLQCTYGSGVAKYNDFWSYEDDEDNTETAEYEYALEIDGFWFPTGTLTFDGHTYDVDIYFAGFYSGFTMKIQIS